MRRALRWASAAALLLATWLSLTPKPPQFDGLPADSDKIAHFIMHFGVSLLLALGWPLRIARPLALSAALLLEIGQIWVPGRTFSLFDICANLAGLAAGLALGGVIARRLRRG